MFVPPTRSNGDTRLVEVDNDGSDNSPMNSPYGPASSRTGARHADYNTCCTFFGIPIPSITKLSAVLLPSPTDLHPHYIQPPESSAFSLADSITDSFADSYNFIIGNIMMTSPKNPQSQIDGSGSNHALSQQGFESIPNVSIDDEDTRSNASTGTVTGVFAQPNHLFPTAVMRACRSKLDVPKVQLVFVIN
jgi:hypothetical protein